MHIVLNSVDHNFRHCLVRIFQMKTKSNACVQSICFLMNIEHTHGDTVYCSMENKELMTFFENHENTLNGQLNQAMV